MEEDLLYSDFKGIRITSKRFYAGGKSYAIKKIKSINLERVTPQKYLGISLFIIGISTILIGALEILKTYTISIFDSLWIIDLNFLFMGAGVLALVYAIVRMLIYPDEYAVEIENKDGTIESVTSDSRKYAARLAASLKRAYYRSIDHTTEKIAI